MKVDVVICTKNSEAILDQCIQSVKNEVPFNRIIIVDGGSSDKTVAIAKQHDCEVYIKPELSLGQSRMFGFKKVETEWFVQVDSDEILLSGWWKEMVRHLDEADVIECGRNCFYKIPFYPSKIRAMFGQNLIKRSIVDEIDETKMDVIVNEDEIFRRLIQQKGFKWLQIPKILANHYGPYYTVPARYPNIELRVEQNVPNWAYFEEGYTDGITRVKSKFLFKIYVAFGFSCRLFFRMLRNAWRYKRGYDKGKQR